jgi:hypothetical protein
MQDAFQLTVNADGTFEEIINSARGGRIYVSGRWEVSGETAVLEGVYQSGPSFINATRKTVTLKRNGHSLEGMRLTHYNNQTHPITFTRASRQSAKPVTKELTHIRDIAGTWIGAAGLPGSPAVSVTMVLRDNGSYETITPSSRLEGSYWITGGKARYRSTTSGRTGTFELREHDGERRLIIVIDGGGGGELRPASK